MERAQFRGGDDLEAKERRQQMSDLLHMPLASQPEDVAKAIWDAVKNQRSGVIRRLRGLQKSYPKLKVALSLSVSPIEDLFDGAGLLWNSVASRVQQGKVR